MTGDVLAAALRHAERGRPVFPCDPRSKRPTTAHGFRDATRKRDTIQQWFGGGRLSMLGLPTGAVTGLVVLDVDPRHGGDESLHDLEHQFGPLPCDRDGQDAVGWRSLLLPLAWGACEVVRWNDRAGNRRPGGRCVCDRATVRNERRASVRR